MHLDAAARATSPVEDRLGRKFASSFRADKVEGNWVEARCCGETGAGFNKRAANNFALAYLGPATQGRLSWEILGTCFA